ncbi:MAG TPA: DUF2950 domain-containing protein [Terriglobales bacterium]|nr:DUF2950 domain-containing protein [Terriglobales bacterium]
MSHLSRSLAVRTSSLAVSVIMVFALAGCSKKEQPTAAPATAQTFASPEAAGKALMEAAKSANQEGMLAIFGPGSKDLIYSGDAAEDKASFDGFVKSYDAMNRWRKLPDGSELLLVGADNQAFPIPLKKNSAGQWYFDTAAGKEEILSRRIGRDENAAIDVCVALADAQAEYFSQKHDGVKQYAQKFISDPGKQNGLYWESAEGQPRSPVGPLVAFATDEGYNLKSGAHQAFHGYYFRILDKQGPDAKGGAKNYIVNGKMTGGFVYIAYPATYNDTGVMTFIIDQNRAVYQKNLGKDTADLAKAIAEFNPDKSWTVLQ